MRDIFLGHRNLIVVDREYYPILFTYKNQHPDLNIKIINKSSLLDKIGYRFSEDPLPLLIKEGIEYNKAKKYLSLIKYLRGYDGDELKEIKDKVSEYLTVDEYGLYELKQYQILLFEMDEDEGIKTLLNRNNLTYNLLHFSDLEIEQNNFFDNPKIRYFSNKFAQFGYIFSDIRQKLAENSELKNKIKILIKGDEDLFYLNTLSKLFDLDIFVASETSLISIPEISQSIKKIFDNKTFDIELDLENENVQILDNLIKQYGLNELGNFDFAYANLLEILTSSTTKLDSGDRGILVTTDYTIKQDDIVYVTNFEYGCFYQEHSDNNVLPDAVIASLGLTTSYNKTALDERKKKNYLFYSNIALLSRVNQHLTDSIYDSHFIKSMNLEMKISEVDKVDEVNLDGLYSQEMSKLMDAHRYDQKYYYRKHGEYRSYDNSFKGVKANALCERESWSITNLEGFYSCPFKYYLDQLIKLPEDMHRMYRGTLIHAVLEDIMHDDFDYEVSFVRGKKEYIKQMKKNNEQLSPKEETYFAIYHYWLKNIVGSLSRIKDHMQLEENKKDHEKEIHFEIDGYKFTGKIDKIINTFNGLDRYYTIVDYKSGSEQYNSMSLVMGKSIQLPLYLYAISTQENPDEFTKGATFGGFAIQRTYFNSIKQGYVDSHKFNEYYLLGKMKMNGISRSSESYWRSFDNTSIQNNEFKPDKARFLSNKLTFEEVNDDSMLLTKDVGLFSFNVEDTVETSKQAVIRIIEAIRNNEFEIAPTNKDISAPLKLDNLVCEYCNHRNICYVNAKKDACDYYRYIRNELLKKEVD